MTRGVYALIIENGKDQNIQIGKLGIFPFPKGYYVYVGSALGTTSSSLEHRLKRHLSSLKKLFWHIDYFLNSEYVKITSILYTNTPERKECALASAIAQLPGTKTTISGFGSSDCKAKCGAHLFYLSTKRNELITQLESTFLKLNLTPILQSQ